MTSRFSILCESSREARRAYARARVSHTDTSSRNVLLPVECEILKLKLNIPREFFPSDGLDKPVALSSVEERRIDTE